VGPDRVIPLSELVVGIRAGRFYVRLPRSGADVIGCAGHMLDNMAAPDACRFPEDILRDRLAQISGFDWCPRPLCRYYFGCSPGGSCCPWLAATLQRHADGTRLLLGQTLRVAAGMLAPLSEARPAAVLSGVWRARTRPEHLAWASALGARAPPPRLSAHGPIVRLAGAARA
jgi:hypothetical protein